MKKYTIPLVLVMALILIAVISSSQRVTSSQETPEPKRGGDGGRIMTPPPAACTGPCTTPGQYCCWLGTDGAYQNTCRGDDGCTTGCVWGPSIFCGVGSTCTPGLGIGSRCKFTRLISGDGRIEETEQFYSIIFGENTFSY